MGGEYKEEHGEEKNLTGIPDALLRRAEEKAGMSFRNVRVHYNSSKPKKVGARATIQGNDIDIASGCEDCLKHELGHLPRQMRGDVRATRTINGYPVNDDPVLEREADEFL